MCGSDPDPSHKECCNGDIQNGSSSDTATYRVGSMNITSNAVEKLEIVMGYSRMIFHFRNSSPEEEPAGFNCFPSNDSFGVTFCSH